VAERQDPRPQYGVGPSRASTRERDARDTIVELAEIQLAGILTGAALLREWMDMTAGYGEQVAKSLVNAARDRQAPADVPADLLDSYRRVLARLAELPRTYAMRFCAELEQVRAAARDDQ